MSDKAEQKHTELPWVNGYGLGVTGPNTPSSAGPTCLEHTQNHEWLKGGPQPERRHTVISKGKDTIAIVVGDQETYKANAEFIHRACNNHYSLVEALEEIAWSNDSKWQADRARQALAEVKQ